MDWAASNAVDIHNTRPSSIPEISDGIPLAFRFESVFPNPFNSNATIRYALEKPYVVKIHVYDILSREVAELRNAPTLAGTHTVNFNADNLTAGIYFVRLEAGTHTATAKVVCIK